MSSWAVDLARDYGFVAVLAVIAYITGSFLERRHYKSIRRREADMRGLMIFPVKRVPDYMDCEKADLVTGSVVISSDYFKQILASLRNLIGGNVHSYESLLDRARREAVLRMKEKAAAIGATMIFNVKFETVRVSAGIGNMAVSVEALAYGTAVRFRESPA